MLHRGIKFAYAVITLMSAAMAFIVLRNFDEVAVAGPSYAVSFSRADNGASGPRAAEMVTTFARENGVNIGRLYHDPRNQSIRRIYLAVGDPQAESSKWLNGSGYPYFSRESKVELRPYAEAANLNPHGDYYVYGSQAVALELTARFADLGYEGEVESLQSVSKLIAYFGQGALLWCFLIVGLVTILSVASAIVLNAKSYGIQRLQGQSFPQVLWRDLSQLARFEVTAATIVGVVALGFLYAYNGLNQFGSFVIVAASFVGVYICIAMATHILTLGLVHRDAILNAVKGEVTAAWAIVGAYLLRVTAIALILTIGSSAAMSFLALSDYARKSQIWTGMGSAYYMRISPGILDERSGKAADRKIGQWIRDADTRREASMAWHHPPNSSIRGTGDHDVLVVNNAYLLKHQIYGADGSRIQPSNLDTVRVLVPLRYAPEQPRIQTGVTEWANRLASRAGTGKTITTASEQVRNDQSILSYAMSFNEGDLILKDSIVVIVTGSSGVIPNEEYTSMASRGELLIEDPDQAMVSLHNADVGQYVLGMTPFAQEAADKYRLARRDAGMQVFNLAAAATVLLITAITLSIVYCRRNAQTLFAKFISGWMFLRTHRGFLAGEAAFTLALAAWMSYQSMTRINSYQMPGAPPAPPGLPTLQILEPALAVGTALFSLALITLTLLRANASFVRAHSASLS